MNIKTVCLICFYTLCVASVIQANNSSDPKNCFGALAVVFKDVANTHQSGVMFSVSLTQTETKELVKYLPEYSNVIICNGEATPKLLRKLKASGQNVLGIVLEIKSVTSSKVVIMGGTQHVGISGETYRYELRNKQGKWRIISRSLWEISVNCPGGGADQGTWVTIHLTNRTAKTKITELISK